MTIVPVAPWEPDRSPLDEGSAIAQNVIPRTEKSFGPFPGPTTIGNPLDSVCLGAFGTEDVYGGVHVFAGTAGFLYRFDAAATAWVQVGSGYNVGTERWRFTQFKNRILAVDFNDQALVYDMASAGLFAALSAGAPRARFVTVTKSFCILGNTTDPIGGAAPFRIWWSAQNDPTYWPSPGSSAAQAVQSDYNDFVGDQGGITGIVGNLGNADLAVFFQRGIWRGVYSGPPTVFQFYHAEGVKGCNVPDSIVPVGAVVFYLGEDGFYSFNGAQSSPIGFQKVDRWFWANVNPAFLNSVTGTYSSIDRTIIWAFPSAKSTTGACDMLLIYTIDLGMWSYALVATERLLRSFPLSRAPIIDSLGNVVDDSAMLPLYDVSGTFLSAPYRPLLAAINPAHTLELFTGPALAAQLTSSETQPIPDARSFIQGVRPLVDGGTPTVSIATRNLIQNVQVYGPDVPMNQIGDCPQRAEGRYLQAVMKLPAGQAWNHVEGFDVRLRKSGTR